MKFNSTTNPALKFIGKLDNYARLEKDIESLRIENKLLNDTADNTQLLKEQVKHF